MGNLLLHLTVVGQNLLCMRVIHIRMPIRILIIDDNNIIRTATKMVLSTEKELTIVGEAPDGPIPRQAQSGCWDVIDRIEAKITGTAEQAQTNPRRRQLDGLQSLLLINLDPPGSVAGYRVDGANPRSYDDHNL